MQRPPFEVLRNGEPIVKHGVRHGVDPKITFGRLLPTLVPRFEEMEACRYANYNFREWKDLTYEEKAMHVAHYRLSRLVKLHSDDAVNQRVEAENKKAAAKAKTKRR